MTSQGTFIVREISVDLYSWACHVSYWHTDIATGRNITGAFLGGERDDERGMKGWRKRNGENTYSPAASHLAWLNGWSPVESCTLRRRHARWWSLVWRSSGRSCPVWNRLGYGSHTPSPATQKHSLHYLQNLNSSFNTDKEILKYDPSCLLC